MERISGEEEIPLAFLPKPEVIVTKCSMVSSVLCTRPGFRLWGQVGRWQVRTGRKNVSTTHKRVHTQHMNW